MNVVVVRHIGRRRWSGKTDRGAKAGLIYLGKPEAD